MTAARLHIAATLFLFVGLALIVAGFAGPAILWQVGLGAIALAMLLSFATRWVTASDERETKSGGEL